MKLEGKLIELLSIMFNKKTDSETQKTSMYANE